MISNLGTIARSGSKAFMTEMAEKGDLNPEAIIGQFGVGFYSAFMVADKIEVFSKHRQAETGHAWESDGTGKYTIQVGDLHWLKCGTLLYVWIVGCFIFKVTLSFLILTKVMLFVIGEEN